METREGECGSIEDVTAAVEGGREGGTEVERERVREGKRKEGGGRDRDYTSLVIDLHAKEDLG